MKRLPTLDGWRAFSIMLVILGHFTSESNRSALGIFQDGIGALGVSIFFAISGYLITTLLLNEFEKEGDISLRDFYIRRAFRILPPSMVYLAFASFFAPWSDIAKCFFFLANYLPLQSTYVGHFWSLSMEEHFYLIWPFMLAYLGPRRALVAGTIAFFVVTGWRVGIHPHTVPAWTLLHRTDGRLDSFFAPCVLAILVHRKPIKFPAWVPPAAMALAVISFAVTRHSMVLSDLQKALQAALFAVMVVATTSNPESLLSRLLETPPMRFIGRISYSLYLWQTPFAFSKMAWWIATPLLTLVAWCSYRFIEQPTLHLGRRLAARKPQPASAL
jgi:peptidoglycan/LPS O-acetylase OafA/YrhL